MWPLLMTLLRRNAVYITLPFAGIIGFIGYNLEGFFSDKYTPYSPSIQDNRAERLSTQLENTKLEKLQFPSVLEKNLPPSLQSESNKGPF